MRLHAHGDLHPIADLERHGQFINSSKKRAAGMAFPIMPVSCLLLARDRGGYGDRITYDCGGGPAFPK